jgi:hypothetical protein
MSSEYKSSEYKSSEYMSSENILSECKSKESYSGSPGKPVVHGGAKHSKRPSVFPDLRFREVEAIVNIGILNICSANGDAGNPCGWHRPYGRDLGWRRKTPSHLG